MTTTDTTIPKIEERKPAASRASPLRNGRWSGYRHLLGARILELKREPEVIFWVFVFPLLLALGLGIAFRNKPADTTSVAVVAGNGAREDAGHAARRHPAAPRSGPRFSSATRR